MYNWPKNTDLYRRVQRFVEALFTKWDKFGQPPRHPKWRDVNLAATVPGWTRWGPAQEMLARLQPATTAANPQGGGSDFDAFLKTQGSVTSNMSQQQRESLFRQFLEWQDSMRRQR